MNFPLILIAVFLLGAKLSTSQCVDAVLPPFNAQGEVCSIDPNDPSYLEVFVVETSASCADALVVTAIVTYTDTVNIVSTVRAISPASLAQGAVTTGTLSFNIPLTGIKNGAPVTIAYTAVDADAGETLSQTVLYTQTLSQSIFFTDTTTTITSTVETTSVTTSTLTNTDYFFVTPTITSVITTAIETILAKRSTTTTIATITPPPKTETKITVTHTTTTVSCLPTQDGGHHRRAAPTAGLRIRQGVSSSFEPPNCGAVSTTFIYTSTVVDVPLTTDTVTSTAIASTTTTITTTGPPTYIFSSVRGTTTITPPPFTITHLTVAPRSTVTTVKTVILTSTILLGGRRAPHCKGDHVPIPPPPYCSFGGGLKKQHY